MVDGTSPLLNALLAAGLLGAAVALTPWLRHTRRRRGRRRHRRPHARDGDVPRLILTPHGRRAAPGPAADRAPPPPTPGQPDAQAPPGTPRSPAQATSATGADRGDPASG
jgi:hypothetical protein